MIVCVAHPAALAHGLQPIPAAALLLGIGDGGKDALAAGTQQMCEGDRAAVHVRRGQISPSVFGPGQCRIRGTKVRCSGLQPCPYSRESLFEFYLIDDAAHQQRVRECNQPVLWIRQV